MDQKEQFKRIFQDFIDKFLTEEERAIPWVKATLLTIIRDAIYSLKTHIKSQDQPEISWDLPFALLTYPVEINWEMLAPTPLKIDEPIPLIKTSKEIDEYLRYNELPEGIFKGSSKEISGLRLLSNNIASITDFLKKPIGERDQAIFLVPSDIIVKWEKLTEKKRRELAPKDISKKGNRTFQLRLSEGTVTDSKTGKQKRIWGTLKVEFRPLQIIVGNRIGHYPVNVGLEIKGCKPARWTEKDKEEFWSFLLEGIAGIIEEEAKAEPQKETPLNIEETPQPQAFEYQRNISVRLTPSVETTVLPQPTVKPYSPEPVLLVKASLHTEKQKFGKKQGSAQRSLFEFLDLETRNKAVEYGIQDVIGIDLTQAQGQALFAIQRLLQETDYRGNLPSEYLDGNNRWKFRGELPVLKFSPAQYLEAFGVTKYETARGKHEFSGEERKDALRALIDLVKKQHIFVYKRVYWEKDKKGKDQERVDRIETIDTLIKIMQGWEALTKQEDRILDSGKATQGTDDKLKVIAISPCPILVDQVDRYFVPKPATCYQEIKLLVGYTSKYVYRFVDFLLTEVAQREITSKGKGNRNWIIERSPEALAYTLRMDAWIKNKQWKQIRGSLKKCYETAQSLGYLTGYEVDIAGKTTTLDRLILNPEKFRRMREIEEERKQFEAKPTLPPS